MFGVRYRVETLVQLARVHSDFADSRANVGGGSSAVPQCSQCLRQARDLLNELLAQVRVDDEDGPFEQKEKKQNTDFWEAIFTKGNQGRGGCSCSFFPV